MKTKITMTADEAAEKLQQYLSNEVLCHGTIEVEILPTSPSMSKTELANFARRVAAYVLPKSEFYRRDFPFVEAKHFVENDELLTIPPLSEAFINQSPKK